jgi:hypothetical protein
MKYFLFFFRSVVLHSVFPFVLCFFTISTSAAATIELTDFESGVIPQGYRRITCAACVDAISVVDSSNINARSGKYAVKFKILQNTSLDTNIGGSRRPRAQLSKPKGISAGLSVDKGKEYWAGFSIFVPNDWVTDNTRHDSIADFHVVRDRCTNGVWDQINGAIEPESSSPLQFDILGNDWRIRSKWDSRPCHTNPTEGQDIVYRKPFKKGVWTDFVVRVIFSYDNKGILQIWKNDGGNNGLELIVDRIGVPNSFNNEVGNYFKFGIYKAKWETQTDSPVQKRVIYFDEVRFADTDGSKSIVSPPSPPSFLAKPNIPATPNIKKEP